MTTWIPVGYLPFSSLIRFIDSNPQYNRRFFDKNGPLDIFLLDGELGRSLATDLSSGVVQSAGVVEDSQRFIWIPVEAWRQREFFEGVPMTAAEYAMLGQTIMYKYDDDAPIFIRPFISQSEFCKWLSGEPLEDLVDPPLTPDGLSATALTPPQPAEDRSTLWMRAYARGMNDAGKKPKRTETVKLCRTELTVTWRQAVAAWDKLPAEWKNPDRRPKE